MNRTLATRLTALGIAALFAVNADAADVTGAGSSFFFPLATKWAGAYAAESGNRVNYQSIGSGGGIAQVKAGTVDFGASDAPLAPEDLQASGLGQFPAVIGGVVPVVNVPGVQPGQLKLTGTLLADIYLGTIKTWNDPAIAALNPGVTLPAQRITVVRRSDGSGTTFNFVNYLSKVSADWKAGPGEGTTVVWPTGVGGKGNEGVAAYVKQIKGGIGYVEYSYALQNKLAHVSMQNAAGQWVQPNAESFQAAAASADWKNAKDFQLVMTDAPGAEAWPIAATVFVLMPKAPTDAGKLEGAKSAKAFFDWSQANGDEAASALDYVPLPDPLVEQIKAYWAAEFKY